MQDFRKIFNKSAFKYYSLLAFITNGKHHFVNKKLVFGALLFGISGQFACKPKTQNNNILPEIKDSIKEKFIKCYVTGSVNKDTADNQLKKHKPNIKKQEKVITIATCYDIAEPVDPPIAECYAAVIDVEKDTNAPFIVVEQMPEFPGGEDSLRNFIRRTIKYPDLARESSVEGTVYINFIIEKDGSVSNPKILRGIGSGCDEEAIRVIKLMPRWIPGKQNGKTVRVQYNLPIKFKLDDEKK
jgi:TonB family protein